MVSSKPKYSSHFVNTHLEQNIVIADKQIVIKMPINILSNRMMAKTPRVHKINRVPHIKINNFYFD